MVKFQELSTEQSESPNFLKHASREWERLATMAVNPMMFMDKEIANEAISEFVKFEDLYKVVFWAETKLPVPKTNMSGKYLEAFNRERQLRNYIADAVIRIGKMA